MGFILLDLGVCFVAFGSGSVPLAALWWNDPSCRDLPAQGANPGLRAERIALCLEQMEHVCTTPPSPPEPLHLLQMDFWGEIVRVCRPPGVSCSTALGVERSFQGSGLLCLCAILGGGGEGVLLHPPRWHRAVGQSSVPRGGPHKTTAHRSEGRRGGEKQEGRDGNSRPKPPQRQTPGKKLISNLPFYYLLFYLKKKKSFNKALCFCSNLILLPGPGFSRLSLSLSLSPTPLPSCSSSSSRR